MKIGKYVRVISNASYKHYKKFGRITGFTKNGKMAFVYFDDTKSKAQFYLSSLELLN